MTCMHGGGVESAAVCTRAKVNSECVAVVTDKGAASKFPRVRLRCGCDVERMMGLPSLAYFGGGLISCAVWYAPPGVSMADLTGGGWLVTDSWCQWGGSRRQSLARGDHAVRQALVANEAKYGVHDTCTTIFRGEGNVSRLAISGFLTNSLSRFPRIHALTRMHPGNPLKRRS